MPEHVNSSGEADHEEELAKYSRSERQRIASTARRNLKSETSLILGAGFALLMVMLFPTGHLTFLPLAEMTGIQPTGIWMGLSFLGAGCVAALNYKLSKTKIERARVLDAKFLYAYQAKQQKEREAKYQDVRTRD